MRDPVPKQPVRRPAVVKAPLQELNARVRLRTCVPPTRAHVRACWGGGGGGGVFCMGQWLAGWVRAFLGLHTINNNRFSTA